jgi:hypothetical protein
LFRRLNREKLIWLSNRKHPARTQSHLGLAQFDRSIVQFAAVNLIVGIYFCFAPEMSQLSQSRLAGAQKRT